MTIELLCDGNGGQRKKKKKKFKIGAWGPFKFFSPSVQSTIHTILKAEERKKKRIIKSLTGQL